VDTRLGQLARRAHADARPYTALYREALVSRTTEGCWVQRLAVCTSAHRPGGEKQRITSGVWKMLPRRSAAGDPWSTAAVFIVWWRSQRAWNVLPTSLPDSFIAFKRPAARFLTEKIVAPLRKYHLICSAVRPTTHTKAPLPFQESQMAISSLYPEGGLTFAADEQNRARFARGSGTCW
jgi:hypothetical protein